MNKSKKKKNGTLQDLRKKIWKAIVGKARDEKRVRKLEEKAHTV